MSHMHRILTSRRGATAIEYGLIAALISVATIAAMSAVGGGVRNTFNNASAKLK